MSGVVSSRDGGDELAARYEILRAAAAEVVHRGVRRRSPLPYTTELHELHRLLLGVARPESARHSLAFTDPEEGGPYDLTKLAEKFRAELATEHLPGESVRKVIMTQLRAMVISSLLGELAARLAPGPAVGADESGRGLAELAAELGEFLLNQTSAGS